MAAPDPPRPTWRSRRRLAIALGVLLALLVAVRVALPEVLRRLIESQGSGALGRKVEVEDVDLGLVMGRAQIEGLRVGGPDRAAPIDPSRALVRLEGLGARIAWLPLLTGKIHLREIALVSPSLRLERNPDGSLTQFVLAEPEPEPEGEGEEGAGIDLAIDRFDLDGAQLQLVSVPDDAPIGELRLEKLTVADLSMQEGVFGIGAVSLRGPDLQVQSDRLAARSEMPPVAAPRPSAAPEPAPVAQPKPVSASRTSKHRIKDLDIESGRFIWRLANGEEVSTQLAIHARDVGRGSQPFPLSIELHTDEATHALEGRLAAEPLRFDGTYRWESMRIERLALLAGDLPVKIAAGRSDGSLKIALSLPPAESGEPAGLRLEGDVRVSDLDLASADGALKLQWKDLALALSELTLPLGDEPGGPEVHLAKLALQQPKLDFSLQPAPGGEAALAPAPDATAKDEPATPPPQVLVDVLELTGGALRFRDTTVRPPVDTSLRDLRIRAQGVRWPERDIAKLVLTAKGQQAATLEIKGGVEGGAGDIDVALRQLPLTTFDPYASKASGLKIDQGRLSLDSKLSLGPKRIGAKNRLSLHQLALSERESGWFQKSFGVPLDVAIALLQDMQGDITLPVDVEQGEGGTQVGIAAAVTAALRQALVGALAAPLKLLGSVAGRAGSAISTGLDPIPMEPGRGEIGADGHQRVDALASLLASRPGLQVVLVGRADASDDPLLARREVLARAKAGESLPGEGELGFFERRRVRSVLADADPEQPDSLDAENAAALERLAGHVKVAEEAREALALARAQSVAQALREGHGVAADSVTGIETGVGAPGVEIELRASNQ